MIKGVLSETDIKGVLSNIEFDNTTLFIITIDTTKGGSANDTFILPTDGASVYDYYVDWGDNQTDHVVVNTSQTHVYTIAGIYRIKISGTFPHIYFNNTGDKLKLISIDNWGKIAWNSFEGAFFGCANMNCTATDSAGTSSVISFENAFRSCSSLVTLDVSGWDTSSATSFERTFNYCSSLIKLNTGGWDTSSVTTLLYTFKDCFSLTAIDVSNWDTSLVTTLYFTFYDCFSLTAIDVSNWDTSKVITFYSTFYNCSSLITINVSNWDTSSATCLGLTFFSCSSLITLDVSNWDTSLVDSFAQTFDGCSSLITIDVTSWNTPLTSNFAYTFRGCTSLKGSFASLDLDRVINLLYMFQYCDINEEGTTANYDATLISWAAQVVKPNIVFNAGNSKYSAGGGGTAARAVLTGAPNNWTIYDGGEL